ncbi:hypothetical protein ZIOFF_057616 [Zingiber officinale]|uniref:Uncharacterized protein n=1 Tax=Zingiber officinale TaxID=94328 RepID=A0A8J5F8Q2_ZINOF|nr:hypothetical protein ZIOFF_057616 [Zingiber officinale]
MAMLGNDPSRRPPLGSSFNLNALPDLHEGEEVPGEKHAEPAPALPPAGAHRRRQGEELPSGPKQCAICLKVFPSVGSLHGHMRCHPVNLRRWVPALLEDAENQRAKRRFICDRCGLVFATRQSLGGHRASHKGRQGCYGLAKEARECGRPGRINRRRNRAFGSDEEAAAAALKDANKMLSILFAEKERPPSAAPPPTDREGVSGSQDVALEGASINPPSIDEPISLPASEQSPEATPAKKKPNYKANEDDRFEVRKKAYLQSSDFIVLVSNFFINSIKFVTKEGVEQLKELKGLKNSSASKRSPLPGMSGNLDPLDGVNPTVIESFPSHHIHSMSVDHQVYPGVSFTSHFDGGHAVGGTGADCRRRCAGIAAVRGGRLQQRQPQDRGGRRGNQLTLSFQGEVYVFDSVSPEKVQVVLLLLGGLAFDMCRRGDMPHRIASLMRFREKRKERNFEKKIRYTVRKEVASSYLVTGEKSGEFTARLLEFIMPAVSKIPEFKMLSTQNSSLHKVSSVHASSSRNEQCADVVWGSQNADALVLKESEIQGTLVDQNESTLEVDSFRSVDSFEGGRSSFNGASHPLEPMDTDMVKSVYVAIDQEKSDAGCLMKGISTKGPKFSLCLYYYYCTESDTWYRKMYHSCSIRHEDLRILLLEIADLHKDAKKLLLYRHPEHRKSILPFASICSLCEILELLVLHKFVLHKLNSETITMRNPGIACIA